MYGGDDTRIIVYNMERWLEEGGGSIRKTLKRKIPRNNPLNIGNRVHRQDIIT